MSTRCIIIIRDRKPNGNVIKLFHRLDGYPKGVGKFLMDNVLPEINKPSFGVNEVANYLIKNKEDEDFLVTAKQHPDIEYRYFIFVDTKEIKCQQVKYKQVDNHFELEVLRRIDLKEELNLNK